MKKIASAPAVLGLATLAACVPSDVSHETPRGAVQVELALRAETYPLTLPRFSDGWEVTIERALALVAPVVSAPQPQASIDPRVYSSACNTRDSPRPRLILLSVPTAFLVRAVEVGICDVSISALFYSYSAYDRDGRYGLQRSEGVSEGEADSFVAMDDEGRTRSYRFIGHAERAGRVVRFDAMLGTSPLFDFSGVSSLSRRPQANPSHRSQSATAKIVENDKVDIVFHFDHARVFRTGRAATSPPAFAAWAAADAAGNDDGVITEAELEAFDVEPGESSPFSEVYDSPYPSSYENERGYYGRLGDYLEGQLALAWSPVP